LAYRYAIYFSPQNTPLSRFGARVLGVDVHRGTQVEQFVLASLPTDRMFEITQTARGYGFHATLKAPFRIAEGASEADLLEAFSAFCDHHAAADLPGLTVQNVRGYLAIVPSHQTSNLRSLERAIVVEFDRFRAPMNEQERAKRNPESLSERQLQHLDIFGYPFVMDDFFFHMTLSNRIGGQPFEMMLHAEMQDQFEKSVPKPDVRLDSLSLVAQPEPDEPFQVIQTRALAGAE